MEERRVCGESVSSSSSHCEGDGYGNFCDKIQTLSTNRLIRREQELGAVHQLKAATVSEIEVRIGLCVMGLMVCVLISWASAEKDATNATSTYKSRSARQNT